MIVLGAVHNFTQLLLPPILPLLLFSVPFSSDPSQSGYGSDLIPTLTEYMPEDSLQCPPSRYDEIFGILGDSIAFRSHLNMEPDSGRILIHKTIWKVQGVQMS